jgi:hypothetical protein
MKKLLIILLALSISLFFIGCPKPVQYELTVTFSNATVTANGDELTSGTAVEYEEGTEVELVVDPDDGYMFDEWTGDIGDATSTDTTITITMDANKNITANTQSEDSDPPAVSSIVPADAATDVNPSASVVVTFDEAMDTTATEGAFTLNDGTSDVSGTVTWDGANEVMTFEPSADLAENTTHTVTITDAATDNAGNALESAPFTSTFTTGNIDTTAPSVSTIVPADAATDVFPDASIIVTFNEAMDTTATEGAFTLNDGTSDVSGTVTWDGANEVMTFEPSADLAENTTHTVTITSSATDVAGNPLDGAPFSSTFTTGTTAVIVWSDDFEGTIEPEWNDFYISGSQPSNINPPVVSADQYSEGAESFKFAVDFTETPKLNNSIKVLDVDVGSADATLIFDLWVNINDAGSDWNYFEFEDNGNLEEEWASDDTDVADESWILDNTYTLTANTHHELAFRLYASTFSGDGSEVAYIDNIRIIDNTSGTTVIMPESHLIMTENDINGDEIADNSTHDLGLVEENVDFNVEFGIVNIGKASVEIDTPIFTDNSGGNYFTFTDNITYPVTLNTYYGLNYNSTQGNPIVFNGPQGGPYTCDFEVDATPDTPADGTLNATFQISAEPPTPHLRVYDPDGNEITDGGTYDYGQLMDGLTQPGQFTIENYGTADLTIGDGSGNVVVLTTGTDFAVDGTDVPNDQDIVAPYGGTDTFTINYSPTGVATHTDVITLHSDDGGSANTFTINLTAECIPYTPISFPEGFEGDGTWGGLTTGNNWILNEDGNTTITLDDTDPYADTYAVKFDAVDNDDSYTFDLSGYIDTTSVDDVLTFKYKRISGSSFSGELNVYLGGSQIGTTINMPGSAGADADYSTFQTPVGVIDTQLELKIEAYSSEWATDPTVFFIDEIDVVPPAPDMAVTEDGVDVPNDNTTAFDAGDVIEGGNVAVTITNNGTGDLTITSIADDGSGDFGIDTNPWNGTDDLIITPGNSEDILFAPASGNTTSALVTINSDDPINPTFEFFLTVNVVPPTFFEGFEGDGTWGGLDSGHTWTINDIAGTGEVWVLADPSGYDLNGTWYTIIDSDGYGSGGDQDCELYSPNNIDVSGGVTNLEFDHYYRHLGSTAEILVYDGSVWNTVADYTADTGGWGAPTHETIDISSYTNTDFQIRIHYSGSWSWYWSIDNITIY